MQVTYQKIESKDIKNYGIVKNKERHLPEGIYTTFNPLLDNSLTAKVKREKKETKQLIDECI